MKHFTERPTNSLLTSVIEETKKKTRTGEIKDELKQIKEQIREEQTNQKNVEERQ